jgi:hypothetical protein
MRSRSAVFAVVAFTICVLSLYKIWSYRGYVLYGWDAQYYYAQARSLLFEGRLDITDSLQLTPQKDPFDRDGDGYLEQPPRQGGRILNKYPIGLSLLEIPWLTLGHAVRTTGRCGSLAGTSETPLGYSKVEMATVAVGLAAYTLFGLLLLCRSVQQQYQSGWSEFAVATTLMGTSLFYYYAVFPFMSHGVAFALVVLILWQALRLRQMPDPGLFPFLALAAAAGLLFLVRPQQILLLPLLVPYLWPAIARFRHAPVLLCIPGGLFLALCGLQVVCNYFNFGTYSLSGYAGTNEGFDWWHPNWYIVLFSPHRGLFWMNPIVLIAIYGFVRYRVLSWFEGAVLLHGITQLYLIATWSSPGQGDAFGPRMWCECTPLVALGIAKLMSHAAPRRRWMWATICLGAVLWTNTLLVLYIKGQLVASCSHTDLFRLVLTREL